ncbi:MAG: phage baseplate protein [Leptolyngbyaceae cyanobacterium RU_5_1]|nr:phage baseplate protein [Leptolyngbyaceae cyanobacterium RU_5_1]
MKSLSAAELLGVWEQGLTQYPVQRSLSLLAAACPDQSLEQLGSLSIGQRDALLLTLREWMFGTELVSVVYCPSCRDRLELTFNVGDIRVSSNADLTEVHLLQIADYHVQFRLPNSLDLTTLIPELVPDLAAVGSIANGTSAQQQLLDRCVLSIHQGESERAIHDVPATVLDTIVEQMADADPQADVQLDLSCPLCGHRWQSTFDIVSFFWSEIHTWANRIVREVHTLASAYGWREADILAMSALRRQLYLGMVGG